MAEDRKGYGKRPRDEDFEIDSLYSESESDLQKDYRTRPGIVISILGGAVMLTIITVLVYFALQQNQRAVVTTADTMVSRESGYPSYPDSREEDRSSPESTGISEKTRASNESETTSRETETTQGDTGRKPSESTEPGTSDMTTEPTQEAHPESSSDPSPAPSEGTPETAPSETLPPGPVIPETPEVPPPETSWQPENTSSDWQDPGNASDWTDPAASTDSRDWSSDWNEGSTDGQPDWTDSTSWQEPGQTGWSETEDTTSSEPTYQDVEYQGLIYRVDNGIATVLKNACSNARIEFPSEVYGYPVMGIEDYAFYGSPNVSLILIPEGVDWISTGAFQDCPNLLQVVMPDSITGIADDAFGTNYGVTIESSAGSFAHNYALNKGMNWIERRQW